jgi:hypothetical protein
MKLTRDNFDATYIDILKCHDFYPYKNSWIPMANYFKCNKCGLSIRKYENLEFYFISSSYNNDVASKLINLTCDEIILKNIL